MNDKELHDKVAAFSFPEPEDLVAWRELFQQLPEVVRLALYDYAPTMPPEAQGAIAWAVIAYTVGQKSALENKNAS